MYPPTPATPATYNVPAIDQWVDTQMRPVEQEWQDWGKFSEDWIRRQQPR
jgi:hypothetical protein